MTAKEKAKYLIDQYRPIVTSWDCYNDMPIPEEEIIEDAKKGALIAVDEVIKSKQLGYLFTEKQISCMEETSDDLWIYETFNEYWEQVKQEIQNFKP